MVKICRALSKRNIFRYRSITRAYGSFAGLCSAACRCHSSVVAVGGFQIERMFVCSSSFFLLISSSSNDFKKIETTKEFFSRSNVTMCNKPLRDGLKWNEGAINKSKLCTYPQEYTLREQVHS